MADFLLPRRHCVVRRECSVEETLPPSHLARFIWSALESLDFSLMEAEYESIERGPGRPPYHPRLLVGLWIYGMTEGMETAAEIARACTLREDFQWLAGGLSPCDQTLLNFLGIGAGTLPDVWEQMLQAMQRAGHVDLNVISEDGTKLRANASRRSFHTSREIEVAIDKMKQLVAEKLKLASEQADPETKRKIQNQLRGAQDRLRRAEKAREELRNRLEEGDRKNPPAEVSGIASSGVAPVHQRGPRAGVRGKFGPGAFQHDPDRDVLICPGKKDLCFLGEYGLSSASGPYRLYHRPDCKDCPLKGQCTEAKGRRVKIYSPRREKLAQSTEPSDHHQVETSAKPHSTFDAAQFRHEPHRNVLICPAGQELRFVGEYCTAEGKDTYRLFERSDCTSCTLKNQCTRAQGRRVKFRLNPTEAKSSDAPPANHQALPEESKQGPVASLTDPESRLMPATPEKRFEPSYNADLSVTRDQIIVSQFLTQTPVDYHHFERALPVVQSTLGQPGSWVGDGHYGTIANLTLAKNQGVPLYAPALCSDDSADTKFGVAEFQHEPDRNVMVCPAGQELMRVGTYGRNTDRPYDLYERRDCGKCPLKEKCTNAPGRRVRLYQHQSLLDELRMRFEEAGGEAEVKRFRGSTSEPVNAQLKQHGLDRFHVRGMPRCSVVLTLACMGHNFMKWKRREDTRKLTLSEAA